MQDNEDNQSKFVIPKELKTPTYANAYRVGFSKAEIVIDFGRSALNENDNKDSIVTVDARIAFPPSMLINLIISLFGIGADYEKKHNTSIGGFSQATPDDKKPNDSDE